MAQQNPGKKLSKRASIRDRSDTNKYARSMKDPTDFDVPGSEARLSLGERMVASGEEGGGSGVGVVGGHSAGQGTWGEETEGGEQHKTGMVKCGWKFRLKRIQIEN